MRNGAEHATQFLVQNRDSRDTKGRVKGSKTHLAPHVSLDAKQRLVNYESHLETDIELAERAL